MIDTLSNERNQIIADVYDEPVNMNEQVENKEAANNIWPSENYFIIMMMMVMIVKLQQLRRSTIGSLYTVV